MRVLQPSEATLNEAAAVLRSGGLVVLPTETVYGLAGSIRHKEAILRIFEIKQRPAENPLIVHVGSRDQLNEVALEIDSRAERIIEAFWPGPVTIVVIKSEAVLKEVTGGGATVAVRMPAHPLALDLIGRVGHPVAAPSANRFMHLSPTRAEDVSPIFGAELDIVLDGGFCAVGLESTVIDCTGEVARILRPGQISREQIEAVVGPTASPDTGGLSSLGPRSPGQYPRHYAPNTPVRIAYRLEREDGGLCIQQSMSSIQVRMPLEPGAYASLLYATLHRLDAMGLKEIVIEAPPKEPEWVAIWDRLSRAATS